MTKHNLWISSVLVVTVIVLRFAKVRKRTTPLCVPMIVIESNFGGAIKWLQNTIEWWEDRQNHFILDFHKNWCCKQVDNNTLLNAIYKPSQR